MKNLLIIICLITASTSTAQVLHKDYTAALQFAQSLAPGYQVQQVDTADCRNCMDVKLQMDGSQLRVQFWRSPDGYQLASITGSYAQLWPLWVQLFDANAAQVFKSTVPVKEKNGLFASFIKGNKLCVIKCVIYNT